MPIQPFKNRQDAGRTLARLLARYAHDPHTLVLALPRGGVPVAAEVAREIAAPLDVFIVRKLGVPGHEELAMGALATGGVRVLNRSVIDHLAIPDNVIDAVTADESRELRRREHHYRGDRPAPDLDGRTVILIDDGLATGATMRAAAAAVKQQHPRKLVIAVPVAAAETCESFRHDVDDIVCALTPQDFRAVGMWYEDFSQTTDEEVRQLLAQPTPDLVAHAPLPADALPPPT